MVLWTRTEAVHSVQAEHGLLQDLIVLPHVLSVKEARSYLVTAPVAINALAERTVHHSVNSAKTARRQMGRHNVMNVTAIHQ